MKTLRTGPVGIDQGEIVLFSDFEDDGPMWAGEGQREIASHVAFSGAFRATPAVTVSLSMWDIAAGANARADVRAEEVSPEGFRIVFRTWGDTRVARVRVAWMALGEVPDPDAWDVP